SEPTTFFINNGLETYSPSNFANIYANKDISMAYAIAVSDNIYAVKTHLFLGPESLINTAHKVGITAQMKPVPSLALGSTEIKLSEMTTAYAHFASLGKKVKPVYITKITDLNDNVIYEYKPIEEQVLDSDLSFLMTHMLEGMFDTRMSENITVTGQSIAGSLSRTYAGKSGSTDYDNTMIGYNPELVLGVWTGFDELVPIIKYEEKSYSKRLWAQVVEEYFQGTENNWYEPSDNIIGVRVNPITGDIYYNTDGYTKVMYYLKGTQPPYRY
ncbi:MAG: penicillin-binding protein family, partial [Haloplasmataceae bacterium]|nr:penicillin-binding protein family [Haloplasmataceae bacterium]